MAKFYRYMSEAEFKKLMNGEVLFNPKKRSVEHTNSNGFCFLAETTTFTTRDWNGNLQEYAWSADYCDFLDGIVSDDMLVEFEVKSPDLLQEGFGVYMNPITTKHDKTIRISEYSCHTYDKTVLKPLRFKVADGDYPNWQRLPWQAI